MNISTEIISALRQSFLDKLDKENGKQTLFILIYVFLTKWPIYHV